ncbi:MAG: ArsR family transcriptional regulator [Candidatus Helarchaeota archaeon]
MGLRKGKERVIEQEVALHIPSDKFEKILNLIVSKGRLRIMKLLLSECEINITAICKTLNYQHGKIEHHLAILSKYDIIIEHRHGRNRFFRWNNQNRLAEVLKEFLLKASACALVSTLAEKV